MFLRGNVYYYRLKKPNSKNYDTAHSTYSASKKEAERIAKHEAALRDIQDTDQSISSNMNLISFVELFYDAEKSPWLQEKWDHNPRALQSDHLRTSRSSFIRYVRKEIPKEYTLNDVQILWLKAIQRKIRKDNPKLKPQTVNNIFSSLVQPLRYAKKNGIIDKDPTEGIMPYTPERKVTGVFTRAELNSLSELDWRNKLGKLAFLLAIHTGMRMGEILALRVDDLEQREISGRGIFLINISHSWSKTHGLKSPKSGRTRIIPIPSSLWLILRNSSNESFIGERFVFSSSKNGKPMSDKILRAALENALERIGVSKQQQEVRNLRFHSTRHYFNSALAPLLQNESLRKVIGHSSPAMTDHYHHVTDSELEMVAVAQNQAFQSISLPRMEVIA